MEKNVKFSVVTICYNVKDELKRTLRSLWAQTYGSTGADLAGDCGGGDDGANLQAIASGMENLRSETVWPVIAADTKASWLTAVPATVRRRFCAGKKDCALCIGTRPRDL